MEINDAAYLAGLFDGEGSVYFKKTRQKKHQRPGKPTHNVMVIRMEISMTDRHVLEWVWETTGVGAFGSKKVQEGYKPQWRWRASHRDALKVCKWLWPFAQTKLHKIEQIIDYYEPEDYLMNGKVVSLEEYRRKMNLE
tara:strand:- start:42 stop:455 length:414 start_codon:yes stop_codon:yes gene_type:complete